MYEYEIWFSLVKLSPRIKKELLQQFDNLEQVWEYCFNKHHDKFTNSKLVDTLNDAWNIDRIKLIGRKVESESINIITLFDKAYPSKLLNLEDAPSILYYKGDITAFENSKNVSVIGSRSCTHYGINITQIICRELCKQNVNIISGMAKGIDTCAHKVCVDNNSYTCAVLGSGIDVIYPRQNIDLYHKIANCGCVISEFPPGTEPFAYNFPIRNRIISALSDLLIVVEAGNKSGSLITAGFALEQGKDVLAVPGSVFSEQSKGTNKLIRDGAYPLTDIEDVLTLLNLKNIPCNKIQKSKKSDIQASIYNTLSNNPIHIDDIIRITKVDIKQIYEVLFELQLKDEIICLSGNFYVKINDKL